MASQQVRKRKRKRQRTVASVSWSQKQLKLFQWFRTNEICLFADGSVRAGKTKACVYGFLKWAYDNFSGKDFILATCTLSQMESVILKELRAFCRDNGVPFRKKGRDIVMKSKNGYNTFIPSVGYDSKSYDKILGITAQGVLCDEGVAMNQEFIDELFNRCSEEGGKLVFTNNPRGPHHWYKKNFIDKAEELYGSHMRFVLSDNPTQDPKYVKMLHKKHSGAELRRKVFGEWAASTGLVYPNLDDVLRVLPDEEPSG